MCIILMCININTCIQLLLIQFLEVIWSMPKISHFSKNRSINFFINSTIPRSIVKKYSLKVSRTLKTGKAFKQGLKHNQFPPQILCLQVSVLIIHWHCFQVSYARAQLAKDINFIERFLEKCEIFRHGPDFLQKLYQKQLNAS